ncbi:MAG: hypothetical protein HQK97_00280 [Nitrospirae bacterium]|nr:hypothetical protein [Nitrospirota bacterium]
MGSKASPTSGKFIATVALSALSAVFWLLSLLFLLHEQEIFIIKWDKIPIEHFRHEAGHAWFAKLPNNSFTPPSRAMLMEDGRPLRRANAGLDAVAYVGGGRYNVSHDELLFSSSDNSDPERNGRKYELLCATASYHGVLAIVFFLAVLSSASLTILLTMRDAGDLLRPVDFFKSFVTRHKKALSRTIAVVSILIVVVPYLITRLPYFLYYPVVLIRPDSYGYFDAAMQITSGTWPDLFLRTPGYPMFIAAVFLFSKQILSVIVAQNLLSLIAALVFIYGIFISYRYMAPLAAIGMSAFITSHVQMASDCSLLSESLYVSVIVSAFACLVIALKRRSSALFACVGAAFAFTVYVRPAGLFVVVVFVLVVLYMWINRYGKKRLTVFAAPFLSMLLILCSYNYITQASFSLDNYGIAPLVSNAVFLEKDDKYPKSLNAAIENIRRVVLPEEWVLLNSTWDLKKYNEIKTNIYNRGGGDSGVTGQIFAALGNPETKEKKKLIKTLVFDAIKKHPLAFMKKVSMSLLIYFGNSSGDSDIYNSINGSYSSLYITTEEEGHTSTNTLIRYINPQRLPYFTVETLQQGNRTARAGEYVQTRLQWFHYFIYTKLQRAVFRNLFWPSAFVIAFVISAVCLVRCRWTNTGAFILLTLGSAVLVHAIGIAASAPPDSRYSYTLEFVYYLLPLMLPICWNNSDG